VPQGLILGPLFFLLYVNDITKVSIDGTKIFLYTDDTSIIVTNPDYNGYKLTMKKYSTRLVNGSKLTCCP
jgi:hypothetical protein